MATIYKPNTYKIRSTFRMTTRESIMNDNKYASFKMLIYGMSCHIQKMTRAIMNRITSDRDYRERKGIYSNSASIRNAIKRLHDTFIFVESRELDGVDFDHREQYDKCGEYMVTKTKKHENIIRKEIQRLNNSQEHPQKELFVDIDTALVIGYAYSNSTIEAIIAMMPDTADYAKARVQFITRFTTSLNYLRHTPQKIWGYKCPYEISSNVAPHTKGIQDGLDAIGKTFDKDEIWDEIIEILKRK